MLNAAVKKIDTGNVASHAGSANADTKNSSSNTSTGKEDVLSKSGAKDELKSGATGKSSETDAIDSIGSNGNSSPYINKNDIGMDDKPDKKADDKDKKKEPDALKKFKAMAAMKAAMITAKLSAKAMALAFMKMLLQMMMQLVTQAAAAVTSFLATVANFFVTAAAYLGVSVAVVMFGGIGALAAVGIIIVTAVASALSGDAAQRDTGLPCDEEFQFIYSSTPSGDTLNNAKKVYSFLHELGYTDTNIAGILGNWDVESGIDPTGTELIYDEPFVTYDEKTEANYKKYKVYLESHEACQCEWLNAMIDRGYMEEIEWADEAHTKPIKYKYLKEDLEYADDGSEYYVSDREFEYCWDCDEGYHVECEHGYTHEHTVYGGAGTYQCTNGYEVPCEHGYAEEHHIPAYHEIDFRQRCLDWTFTPPGVASAGQIRLPWVLPDDTSIPFYDHEDGHAEGFKLYDTNTSYDNAYCGIGLGQWTNGRNRMLMAFSRSRNLPWYSIDTQLAFMFADDGDVASARHFLKNWKEEPNPQQAAYQFAKKWEGNTTMKMQERKQCAASWYVTISEWHANGDFDASYGQSLINMAGVTADSATNIAAGRQLESCGWFVNADNSSIATAAVSFAWEHKDMAHNDGTQLWRCVKDAVLGAHDGDGCSWKYKSCDRTAASAIRWSGADNTFPAGNVKTQLAYVTSHSDKWVRIPWDGNKESLQPGDIMIKVTGAGNNHIMIFTGNEAIAKKYPHLAGTNYCIVDGSLSDRSPACKPFSSSYYHPGIYDIYRCKRPESSPMYTNIGCNGLSGEAP